MGSVVDRLKGRKATHIVDDIRPVDKSDAQMPHSGSLGAFNQNTESPQGGHQRIPQSEWEPIYLGGYSA
ncbi:MFS general substrate transporter [Penicillium longicatenatum]|nr:MFS general substrate transporter [Penicillium longicatenatum]